MASSAVPLCLPDRRPRPPRPPGDGNEEAFRAVDKFLEDFNPSKPRPRAL